MRALALVLIVTACSAKNDAGYSVTSGDPAQAWTEVRDRCECVAPACVTTRVELEAALCRTQAAELALVRVTASTCTGRTTEALLSDTWRDFFVFQGDRLTGCSSPSAGINTGVGSGLDLEPACTEPTTYCLPCRRAYTPELAALLDTEIKAGPCP